MLNELIIAKGVLGGISVLVGLITMASILFVISSFGLFLTKAKSSRGIWIVRSILWMLGGMAGLIVALILGGMIYGYFGFAREQYAFNLDLKNPNSIEPFKIKPCLEKEYSAQVNQDCIYEGEITVKAVFSEDRRIETKVKALWASGEDGRLTSMHLFYLPMSMDQLLTTAKPIFSDWGIAAEELEDWRAKALVDPENAPRYFYLPDELRKNPWVEISLRHLEGNEPNNWSISVKWHWDKLD